VVETQVETYMESPFYRTDGVLRNCIAGNEHRLFSKQERAHIMGAIQQ